MKTTKLFFRTIALAFLGITSMNAQSNLITNGDFETFGTDGKPTAWSCTSTSTTYSASTDAHSGTSALSIVTTNANQRNLNQALPTPLTAGETYTLSFWYKCTSAPTSSTFKSEIQWVGDEGGITPYMSVTADISELNVWKQATISAVVPEGTTSAKLYFFITNKPAIIIDDVVVTKGTAKQDQTITGLSDVTKTYGDADFDLSASASSNLPVAYNSSNENVATINGSTVHIVGVGSTTITASQAGDNTYNAATNVTATLTVTAATVAVTGVTLNKTTLALTAGGSETLTATLAPETATNKNVTWSSSDATIATVDNAGKVTAVAAGTATITVTTTDGSKTATCAVTVTAATVAVTGVTLNKSTLSLSTGDSETLTATLAPGNATNKNVTWSSSDATIATVDANGLVTAVAAGTATITVTTTDGSKTATCAVTVTAAVTYTWLLAPAIAIEGTNAKVVGTDADKFTLFFINDVAATFTDGMVSLAGKTGDLSLKATTADGASIIKLKVNK
jgi:hypothetical protein